MPLPDFLLLADAYVEARTPPDKRRPAPVPASVIEALKRRNGG